MTLPQIKAKMKSYRDLLGGDLVGFDEIDSAKTKEELREILNQHDRYLENVLNDAQHHLKAFRNQIDLR